MLFLGKAIDIAKTDKGPFMPFFLRRKKSVPLTLRVETMQDTAYRTEHEIRAQPGDILCQPQLNVKTSSTVFSHERAH